LQCISQMEKPATRLAGRLPLHQLILCSFVWALKIKIFLVWLKHITGKRKPVQRWWRGSLSWWLHFFEEVNRFKKDAEQY